MKKRLVGNAVTYANPTKSKKKKKFFILEKSSGKGHFSLKCLIEKFKVFFSTVSGWPRIATFSITLIAKS